MRKSSKKVLDRAYEVVEEWAESSPGQPFWSDRIVHLIMALEQYDKQRFFAHYELGIKRSLALRNLEKEKEE